MSQDSEDRQPQHSPPSPSERIRTYRCPGCNGNVKFEPVNGCLTCPYCGREERIPDSAAEIKENSYEDYLKPHPGQLLSPSEQFQEHSCPNCNAILELSSEQLAGECPFCDTQMVLLQESRDPLIAPEALLPLKVSQETAQSSVSTWLKTRWFAPNALKKFATQETLQGIYLPYWTFDSSTTSIYVGQRGEYYYETETVTEYVDGKPRQVSRQVRKVRWYPAGGRVDRWFDDVTVPGSLSLNTNHLDGLDPWDLSELKPYDTAYISGFKAERYRVDLSQGFERAKDKMAGTIAEDVQRDIGGDEQRILNIQTSYAAITFKHVLLPVWAGAYRFQGKVYQVVVNGRSAEVLGDRPYSVWKILFAVFLAILAAILFINLQQRSQAVQQRPGSVYSEGNSSQGY